MAGGSLTAPWELPSGNCLAVCSMLEEYVLDCCRGEPRCWCDTASDPAVAGPYYPTPAVVLEIDPSMVGATPGHHEPNASGRVDLLLPLQPIASTRRLGLLKGTNRPTWRMRWFGHCRAVPPSDR